jgi:hypothetical protein
MFQLINQRLIQELSIQELKHVELNMPGKLRTRPKPPQRQQVPMGLEILQMQFIGPR